MERDVRLYLEKASYDGSVHLKIDAGAAGTWFIATVTMDGKLFLHAAVPSGIGLKVDKNGRIEITSDPQA